MNPVIEYVRVTAAPPLRLGGRVLTSSGKMGVVVGESWRDGVETALVLELRGGNDFLKALGK